VVAIVPGSNYKTSEAELQGGPFTPPLTRVGGNHQRPTPHERLQKEMRYVRPSGASKTPPSADPGAGLPSTGGMKLTDFFSAQIALEDILV